MAIAIWSMHPHPMRECGGEGVVCCMCGSPMEDRWYTADDTRIEEEYDDEGESYDVCLGHLNPGCSEECCAILDARKNPNLAVGEGL